VVELRSADAGAELASYADGAFDFVFLDSKRDAYVGYWEDLLRVLAPGGVLAVDNVLSHAAEVAEFRALVEAEPRVLSSVVPVGAGLMLISLQR
jgi:predicted O-methyltransferase YrrM